MERRAGGERRADEGVQRNGRYVERRKPEAGLEGTEGQGAYRNNHRCVAEQRPTEKEHPCQGNGQVCIVSRPGTAEREAVNACVRRKFAAAIDEHNRGTLRWRSTSGPVIHSDLVRI